MSRSQVVSILGVSVGSNVAMQGSVRHQLHMAVRPAHFAAYHPIAIWRRKLCATTMKLEMRSET